MLVTSLFRRRQCAQQLLLCLLCLYRASGRGLKQAAARNVSCTEVNDMNDLEREVRSFTGQAKLLCLAGGAENMCVLLACMAGLLVIPRLNSENPPTPSYFMLSSLR